MWDAARSVCKPQGRDCFAWARFYAGGLAYYGGFLGASLAAWYLLRADRFPFWKAADMAGMVVPLGLGFGRMGCLLAGCCFGSPTSSSLGLVFPPNSPASESEFKAGLLHSMSESSLSIHPTQIYESGASFRDFGACSSSTCTVESATTARYFWPSPCCTPRCASGSSSCAVTTAASCSG